MATVHRETSWGTDPGASTQKWEIEPRKGSSAERLKHLAQVEPTFSRPNRAGPAKKEESPTIEISEFGDAEAEAAIVIAVTEDLELRNALTEALSRDVVLFAETPEQVFARPVPDNCGVLIVEQSLGRPTFEKLKSHLKASAPAMVSIMVGTQNDGSSLVGLLSSGSIDRFMVKPLKLGPTRSALRSALQQHQSQRSRGEGERARPTLFAVESVPPAAQESTHLNTLVDAEAMERRDEQEVNARGTPVDLPSVAMSHLDSVNLAEPTVLSRIKASVQAQATESLLPHDVQVNAATPRQMPTPSWSLVAAVIIAVAGFVAWGMSTRTPDLNVGKAVAGHLATAQKAFEVGNYVDPPELSAAHFYTVALELDPTSTQAKRGLETVADKLIADGRQLIAAGDLLRAQSTLDSARRVQPNHRELAAVTTSLLQARDTERLAINAAHTATRSNAEVSATMLPAVTAASQKEPAAEGLSATNERKTTPQRQERGVKSEAAPVAKAVSRPSKLKLPDPKVVPVDAQSSTSLNSSLQTAQAEATSRVALKVATLPSVVTEAPTIVAAAPASVSALAAGAAPGSAPSAANEKLKLIKYVAPVYPSIARGSNNEGWLDVNFQVTTDGSVINPNIGDGTASRLFHRAAINAVTQWKFSPAPNGAIEPRPMHVRLEFKLTN